MNAIVGLCHFCEAHGPRSLFCTFTTDEEKHTTESSKSSVSCTGCTSLGPETVYVTKDDDGTIYCSRESVPNPDVTAFLRQAAIRSITCEVSWSKEGGVVYFSDKGGHVLTMMFQLQDTRARGLKRWFSIVVLMKDKMFLLNVTPLLSDHMEKIAKELQDLADIVFNEEQKVCSQRALRLRTGRNDFGPSRSLIQLTGDENIFKKLHSHFTFMLKAGALAYSESQYTSLDLLQKLDPRTDKGIFEANACSLKEDGMPLRAIENVLGKPVFRILLYCVVTGIEVVIKPKNIDIENLLKGLTTLFPTPENEVNPHIRISNVEVEPALGLCFIEETESSNFRCNWPGVLPVKCPTLMNRIESAIANPKFNDEVLHQHIKSLLLEWLGIAKALKTAIESSGAKSDSVVKLKQVLGVTPQDDSVVNYWMSVYCV